VDDVNSGLTEPREFRAMTDYVLVLNMQNAVQSIRGRVSKTYLTEEDPPHGLNEDERETLEHAYRLTVEVMTMVLDRMDEAKAGSA
jgi:hypothetical protein